MAGLNKALLIGHLGRDPETRRTTHGGDVTSFSLATSESWKDKTTGERKDKTEWHQVVIFNEPIGKIAQQYLRKGSKVYVAGVIRTRDYKDKQGVDRKATDIVLENFRGELVLLDSQSNRPPPADDPGAYGSAKSSQSAAPPPIDDDITF